MKQADDSPQAALSEAVDTPAARKKGPRGRVHVFDNWCKGCGICIAFCPQQVYEMDAEGRPIVARPDACTACHWCDTHCPDFAITVTRVEEEGADDRQTDAGE